MFHHGLDLLSFNIKLIGKKNKKNVLISAGNLKNKEKLLPSIKKLSSLNISIYATKGTSRFLTENGISNIELFKIVAKREPNIEQFLKEDKLDLIINILTGNCDYDEGSDNVLIRSLSIQNGIPLITDIDVAVMIIDKMLKDNIEGIYKYKIKDKTEPWNLRSRFFQYVKELGGFACYHAHFDKSYLVTEDNLKLSQMNMKKKWELYKYFKENYTYDDLVERMSRCIEIMIEQGVTYCRTLVDVDSTVKFVPLKAALEVKEKYKNKIYLEIGTQPLEGLLNIETRKFFRKACEMADVIGGLPSKDRPTPEKHLDYIMGMAKELKKPLDVHIDQENNPYENETELLALKTIEHGLEGRVSGIHAISVSAKPKFEQDRILDLVKDAGLKIIVCPSAALSMKSLELDAPIHNSIAPLEKILKKEIPVYLGIDNIADIFMPFVDGNMWFECRMLMEACRYYNLEKIVNIACDKSGFLFNKK